MYTLMAVQLRNHMKTKQVIQFDPATVTVYHLICHGNVVSFTLMQIQIPKGDQQKCLLTQRLTGKFGFL
jgi:hypothetical protein